MQGIGMRRGLVEGLLLTVLADDGCLVELLAELVDEFADGSGAWVSGDAVRNVADVVDVHVLSVRLVVNGSGVVGVLVVWGVRVGMRVSSACLVG